MVGVSAITRAGGQASAPEAGAEEFPRPELVTEMAPPVVTLDDHPPMPRRTRVAAHVRAPHEDAGVAQAADASVPDPGAVADGSGQTMFTARPDLNVLAQVLQGLRRMALRAAGPAVRGPAATSYFRMPGIPGRKPFVRIALNSRGAGVYCVTGHQRSVVPAKFPAINLRTAARVATLSLTSY